MRHAVYACLTLLFSLSAGALELTPRAARLFPGGGGTPELVQDAALPDGAYIRQPAGHTEDWNIQWNDFDLASLPRDEEYRVEILVRMVRPTGRGAAFTFGSWIHERSAQVLERRVRIEEAPADAFAWVVVGNLRTPESHTTVYLSPVRGAPLEAVDIGGVRLTSRAELPDPFSAALYDPASPWRNALRPAGARVPLTLTAAGGARYELVSPPGATPQETYAARLLRRLLTRMTGAVFPLVETPTGKPAVFFETSAAHGEVGYAIAVEGENLRLAGGTRRGPINAVLALLEEDLGVRRYSRYDELRVPALDRGIVEVTPRAYTPSLRMRDPMLYDAFDSDWALWNRTNPAWEYAMSFPAEWGGLQGHPSELFCHTFDFLVPAAMYFADHPDYFPLVKGERQAHQPGHLLRQLCLTHPDLPALAAERIRSVLRGRPPFAYVSVSQNDGPGGWCECERCAALLATEGSPAGPNLFFVNAVAALLKDEFPDLQVSTLAYEDTFRPPRTIRPAENVAVWLATDKHIWKHPYRFITETEDFQNAFRAWRTIGVAPLIWDYTFGDNRHWLNPAPNLDVWYGNYRYLVENGIQGMFFQGDFSGPGSPRGPLTAWLQAKLLWNPDWRLDELVEDFTLGFYGPAGNAMTRYNEILHDYWRDYHEGRPADEPLVATPAFIARLRAVLEEAKAACADAPDFLPLVEREEASPLYAALLRPPKTPDEKEVYGRDLARFLELIDRFGIHSFSETEPPEARILGFRRNLARAGDAPPAPGAFDLPLEKARLWPVGAATAAWKEDPADGRIAIHQPCPEGHWSVQWNTFDHPGLTPGKRYAVSAQIKLVGPKGAGDVLQAGVWDHGDGRHLMERRISAAKLSADQYRWVSLGTLNLPEPGRNITLYIGPAANAAATGYYLNAVALIPQ